MGWIGVSEEIDNCLLLYTTLILTKFRGAEKLYKFVQKSPVRFC